jgi:peptide/nickel transport system permease protein
MATSALSRALSGDVAWSFRHSWSARISALALVVLFAAALLAPMLANQNPYDIGS